MKKYILYPLAVYAVLGFFILPNILKSQLSQIVQNETNAYLYCEDISFNPFIFKLFIKNVELQDLDKNKLLTFEKLNIDMEFYSLFVGAVHLKELTLVNPKIFLRYEKDKSINLLKILKEKNNTPKKKEENINLPHIVIDNFSLVDGLLEYQDFTLKQEFDFSLDRISFVVKNIDTQTIEKGTTSLRFHTNLGDGGYLDFKSKLVSLQPFTTEGSIDFEASKLYTEWKYLQEKLNLEVADGKISFNADYYVNLDDLNNTKITKLNLAFDKIRIKPKYQYKDVLNLEHACVKNATILPMQQDIKIEQVSLNTLKVKVKRDKEEQIDWVAFIKTKFDNASKPDETTTTASKPWNVFVKEIKLEKIALDFEDKGIVPSVTTQLHSFNFYAYNATLLGKEPMRYKMNLWLNDAFKCTSNGTLVHNILDIQTNTSCQNFDIVHYKPYIDTIAKTKLDVYNLNLKHAKLDFDANVRVQEKNKELAIRVQDANISLKKLKVEKTSSKENLLALERIAVDGIRVDTLEKKVQVANFSLDNVVLNTRRYKNGKLNLDKLIVVKKAKTKSTSTTQKPYDINLKHFALKNAKVNFEDNAISKQVKNKLDKINFNAYDIASKKNTWLKYTFSMRVNKKGTLLSDGKVQHTPLVQKGNFELRAISLQELTPYIQEFAFINIDDGDISLKTKTHFAKTKNKPDLSLNGSFSLDNFYAVDSRDKSALIAFSKIGLKSFTLELAPNRFYTDEVDIGSFYIDALIDKKSQINFAKLMKNQTNQEQNTTQETTQEPVFPVKIVRVNISEGNVKFADLSIPIEFRTNIHNLNGEIYTISNIPGETTTVDLIGEVDDYGSTKLSGAINASNPKEFTDISFNFKNLEMHSFSGYSASFAGHEIDGGKLYLDLGYKINKSQLNGQNSIIIKQMQLGREIEDENVTKLPLGFVIALLEDSDGVIDIDMPVEGNVDEPDFKYGTLVWKTIGGLIVKAVSSPFTFLGSLMGIDGEELKYTEFEAGRAIILPTEREKLDTIVKMMIKRPKINLALTPTYDNVLDKKAMQLDKLIDMVVKRSGIKNKKDHKSAMTIDMLEDIYDDLSTKDNLDVVQEKLEKQYPKKDEEYERAYLFELSRLDSDLQVLTQVELENLANKRVSLMVKYLTEVKMLSPNRIVKLPLQVTQDAEEDLVRMPLEIKVK